MNVLHICNSYAYNSLYRNLTLKISNLNFKQIVFVPIRKRLTIKGNIIYNKNIEVFYSKSINIFDRLFFLKKTRKLYKNIIENIPLNNVSVTHAHTLFSDGALALKLKKNKGIKYIVAIRNTDIYIFFKYFFFCRKLGIQILKEAERIIFISPAYIEPLFSKYIPQTLHDEIRKKIISIPNGVHDFWFQNKVSVPKHRSNNAKLIYVGDFTANKNVMSVINAVEQLNQEHFSVTLTIIGGGEHRSKRVLHYINQSNENIIHYEGRIDDKNTLLKYYRNCDVFIMPSFHETFGLVYIEAMSQGLPVIFSKGQGIDGYFKDNFPGYSVDPHSVIDIKEKIIKAFDNIEELSINSLKQVDSFSWDLISKEYAELYKSISTNFN